METLLELTKCKRTWKSGAKRLDSITLQHEPVGFAKQHSVLLNDCQTDIKHRISLALAPSAITTAAALARNSIQVARA